MNFQNMYGYIGFFFHYEPNFLPFRPKKARKRAFFVTIFSSNATSWIISNQSIVVVAPKVIKISHSSFQSGPHTRPYLSFQKMTIFSWKQMFLEKVEWKKSKISLAEVRTSLKWLEYTSVMSEQRFQPFKPTTGHLVVKFYLHLWFLTDWFCRV